MDEWPIGALSGGQKQRLSLARSLIQEPYFLIADEPTGAVDSIMAQDIIELLIYFHKKYRMGLIIATHDEAVADRMDTCLKIENRKLRELEKRLHYVSSDSQDISSYKKRVV